MRLHRIKQMIQGNKAVLCMAYVALDTVQGLISAFGWTKADNGAAHASMDLDASVGYVGEVYGDYIKYAGIDHFSGTVAEIGPGDNFGVSLLMRKGGAEEVFAIDRFYSRRDEASQDKIYEALSQKHDMADLFDGVPSEKNILNLHYKYGEPAETFFADREQEYDALVSRAVFEHLFDPIKVLRDTTEKLKPGGVQVHEIDLRDHGMFFGHHPLTFLTVSKGLYRLMTKNAGRPNRVMNHVYKDWLQASGLDFEIRIKGLVGVDVSFEPDTWDNLDTALKSKAIKIVQDIRPALSAEFTDVADEELAASIVILVLKKQNDT